MAKNGTPGSAQSSTLAQYTVESNVPLEGSATAYNQNAGAIPQATTSTFETLNRGVSSPPRGFFASIGYAFVHSFEFVKETIWGKEEVSLSSEGSGESNDETSDNEMQANPSKSCFERIKNIFAWIPYFGSFFEIKLETAKILNTLKNQGIPRIPEEILPYLTDKDLKAIQGGLLMQCNRWHNNGGCPESALEDLRKCTAELEKRKALQAAADEQSGAIENYNPQLGDEVNNHPKFSFGSIKNIFAWIPYFGSFFSTGNEIKKEINPPKTEGSNFKNPEKEFPAVDNVGSNFKDQENGSSNADTKKFTAVDNVGSSDDSPEETTLKQTPHKVPTQEEIKQCLDAIYLTLRNEDIPIIPEEILPHLTNQELTKLRGALVFRCLFLQEQRRNPEKVAPELVLGIKKCQREEKAREDAVPPADCVVAGHDDSSDDDY